MKISLGSKEDGLLEADSREKSIGIVVPITVSFLHSGLAT